MYKKSIGLRLLAYIIDVLMIFIIAGLLNLLFGFGTLTKSEMGFQLNLNIYEMTFVSLIYFLLFALIAKGKTIGKLITRIEIKGINFQEIDNKKLILREVIKSVLMVINIISFIVILVNKDKKSIHDLIVDTMVVRKVNSNEFVYNNQMNTKIEENSNSSN